MLDFCSELTLEEVIRDLCVDVHRVGSEYFVKYLKRDCVVLIAELGAEYYEGIEVSLESLGSLENTLCMIDVILEERKISGDEQRARSEVAKAVSELISTDECALTFFVESGGVMMLKKWLIEWPDMMSEILELLVLLPISLNCGINFFNYLPKKVLESVGKWTITSVLNALRREELTVPAIAGTPRITMPVKELTLNEDKMMETGKAHPEITPSRLKRKLSQISPILSEPCVIRPKKRRVTWNDSIIVTKVPMNRTRTLRRSSDTQEITSSTVVREEAKRIHRVHHEADIIIEKSIYRISQHDVPVAPLCFQENGSSPHSDLEEYIQDIPARPRIRKPKRRSRKKKSMNRLVKLQQKTPKKSKRKTKYCSYYQQGICNKTDDRCPFIHKPDPKLFVTRGY